MISVKTAQTAARHWELDFKALRPDLLLQGSPERCLCRTAFEDKIGRLFVLEKIAPARLETKRLICRVLDHLWTHSLNQAVPYLKTADSAFPVFCEGGWWLISPFIAGTPLDRPAYIKTAPKGASLARFLCDLSRYAGTIPHDPVLPAFSLKHYILEMEQQMAQHDPDVGHRVSPVLGFLKNSFMDRHDSLPVAFCHGDYHPLNVIWQDDVVLAVIDWEFCGTKPDIYDAANLVGCVGMEHPSGLTGNLVMTFLSGIRGASVISPQSWDLFAEFVLALRFAWMAEWLRKKDSEMVELEIVYMHLLMDNMEALKAAWGVPDRCPWKE